MLLAAPPSIQGAVGLQDPAAKANILEVPVVEPPVMKEKEAIAMEEDSPSDTEKYDKLGKKWVCILKPATQCSAPYLGYSHKQNLNKHIRKEHPTEVNSMVVKSRISYTNAQSTIMNNWFHALKDIVATGQLPEPMETDDQLIQQYKQLTDGNDNKHELSDFLSKTEEKALERQRYVVTLHTHHSILFTLFTECISKEILKNTMGINAGTGRQTSSTPPKLSGRNGTRCMVLLLHKKKKIMIHTVIL